MYPAVNNQSLGHRREELLLKPDVLPRRCGVPLRKLCYPIWTTSSVEFLLDRVKSTKGATRNFGRHHTPRHDDKAASRANRTANQNLARVF